MSENDKLKDFLDKNLKRELKTPVNEWSQIVEKINNEEAVSTLWWKWPSVGFGALATLALVAFLIRGPSTNDNLISSQEPLSLVEFMIDTQVDFESEDETDDYSYLALIE